MKKKYALLLLSFLFVSVMSLCQTKSVYDSLLAKQLGADDYGMKTYVMAFLKKGPLEIKDSAARMQLILGHLKNMQRLAKEGKLVVAGPFIHMPKMESALMPKAKNNSADDNIDGSALEGIFIFNVPTLDEAQLLTATDPAVKAGLFIVELHQWYGSAALMKINEIHRQVQKKNFAE
jgi:uncharacterized protein YciI